MKSRTIGGVLSAVAILSLVLAGCSGSAESSEEADAGPITMWVMGSKGPAMEKTLAGFTEETGIDVQVQAIPWSEVKAKVTTAAASGQGPDVIQIGIDRQAEWADAGVLLDLSDRLQEYPNLSADAFIDASANTMTVGDQTVAVPWISDTRVLFYRTDLLTEAGFSKAPATWDELTKAATTLTARGDGSYGVGINLDDQAIPLVLTWSAGGDVEVDGKVNLDTAAFEEAIAYEHNFFDDGLTPARMQKDEDMIAGFKDGSIPMFISGPYMTSSLGEQAPELKGAWSVAPVPAKKSSTSLLAGSNLGIFATSERVDEGMKLISYLAREDVQLAWNAATNDLPAVQSALDKLADDPVIGVYAEQIGSSKAIPLVPNWGAISQEINRARQQINLRGVDPVDTVAALQQAVAAM